MPGQPMEGSRPAAGRSAQGSRPSLANPPEGQQVLPAERLELPTSLYRPAQGYLVRIFEVAAYG